MNDTFKPVLIGGPEKGIILFYQYYPVEKNIDALTMVLYAPEKRQYRSVMRPEQLQALMFAGTAHELTAVDAIAVWASKFMIVSPFENISIMLSDEQWGKLCYVISAWLEQRGYSFPIAADLPPTPPPAPLTDDEPEPALPDEDTQPVHPYGTTVVSDADFDETDDVDSYTWGLMQSSPYVEPEPTRAKADRQPDDPALYQGTDSD